MQIQAPKHQSTRVRRALRWRTLSAVAGAALTLLALTSCGGAAGSQPPKLPRNAVKVKIVGNPYGNPDSLYVPATVHIVVGQTVEWLQTDDSKHTVTPDANAPPGWTGGSSILSQGQTYIHRFAKPGVFRYHCMVHPNMFGTVVVRKR